jgi:hypothetical protein
MIYLPLVIATCHPRPTVHLILSLLLLALITWPTPSLLIKLPQASLDQHEQTYALITGPPQPHRNTILKCRIVEHLQEVEQTTQGKPCQSVCLYIKECNKGFPRNKPLCNVILFGEDSYFLDDATKTRGPPKGWCILVLDDNWRGRRRR